MKLKELGISKCNIRESKDTDDISNLKGSIKENSLINKLVLRKNKDKYEIIAGSRRYRALLDLYGEDYELPDNSYVFMDDLNDEKALLLSITENQQRLDLSPMELNRAILALNSKGYKDKEISKILNITPHRLKRLSTLAQDQKRMPEAAREELKKPLEESKLNDAHWDKIKDIENTDVIKDVVDFIINKETPPREVPAIIKAVEKQYVKDNPIPSDKPSTSQKEPEPSDPIEYIHKGELVMEIKGEERIIKVLGKGNENESEVVPINHYIEYLSHPEKFKCYVTFKLKIKPILE